MATKKVLKYCAIMPIYANQCENGTADINFSSPKDALPIVRQLQKKKKKILTRFNRRREKNIMGPSGPPMHLSFN